MLTLFSKVGKVSAFFNILSWGKIFICIDDIMGRTTTNSPESSCGTAGSRTDYHVLASFFIASVGLLGDPDETWNPIQSSSPKMWLGLQRWIISL